MTPDRRDYSERVDATVDRLVSEAPPLTPEQRDRLRALLAARHIPEAAS